MILYAGVRLRLPGVAILRGVGPVVLAILVLYALWFALSTLAVWFVKIYNVTEVLRGLLDAGRFPISAYPVGYRFFFTFIVPVTFMTTIPAQAILGRAEHQWLLAAAGVAVLLLVLSRMFWKYAMRHYTSASRP
jgi:ABC-2 type transport system permease protein